MAVQVHNVPLVIVHVSGKLLIFVQVHNILLLVLQVSCKHLIVILVHNILLLISKVGFIHLVVLGVPISPTITGYTGNRSRFSDISDMWAPVVYANK